jgi:hypothetical protein
MEDIFIGPDRRGLCDSLCSVAVTNNQFFGHRASNVSGFSVLDQVVVADAYCVVREGKYEGRFRYADFVPTSAQIVAGSHAV